MLKYIAALAMILVPQVVAATTYQFTGIISSSVMEQGHNAGFDGYNIKAPGFMDVGQRFTIRYEETQDRKFRITAPGFTYYDEFQPDMGFPAYSTLDFADGILYIDRREVIPPLVQVSYVHTEINGRIVFSPFTLVAPNKLGLSDAEYLIQIVAFNGTTGSYRIGDHDSSGGLFLTFDHVTSSIVAGVPEPQIWLELVSGFALIGVALRRHTSGGQAEAKIT